MNKKQGREQEHLEWELPIDGDTITHLTFENQLYNFNRNSIIFLSRDNQYDLLASISGVAASPEELEPNMGKTAGTPVAKEIIIGFSKDGLYKYRLHGIVLKSTQSQHKSIHNQSVDFQSSLMIERVDKFLGDYEDDVIRKVDKIQEWYLSGKSEITFSRTTKRSVQNSYLRIREQVDLESEPRVIKDYGTNRDYLFIQGADFSFIVSKVLGAFGPIWSYNLSVEYRQSFGKIPNQEEREAVSELVGFVFGHQLFKIGESSYDNQDNLLLQTYQNPWGDNIIDKCQKSALQPVDIGDFNDWGRAEILLNEFLPHYLSQRKVLNLKDVLWKYWIARYSYIGTNLPILSSAIETLAKQVIDCHPEVQPHIESKEFIDMIKDELSTIEAKLDKNPNKSRIINKIKGAAQIGPNEKLELMFSIIDLNIGKVEKKALQARNRMAHSSMGDMDESGLRETIRLTMAYETLFHRIILKLLGYNRHYTDYYNYGHPKRNIAQPIPEG